MQANGISEWQDFDGSTYDRERDQVRLSGQLREVFKLMELAPIWWTLEQLQKAVTDTTGKHCTESSISARLRDLRKEKYGAHNIEREHAGMGLWKYRMVKP